MKWFGEFLLSCGIEDSQDLMQMFLVLLMFLFFLSILGVFIYWFPIVMSVLIGIITFVVFFLKFVDKCIKRASCNEKP